jgi:hypothetical protein
MGLAVVNESYLRFIIRGSAGDGVGLGEYLFKNNEREVKCMITPEFMDLIMVAPGVFLIVSLIIFVYYGFAWGTVFKKMREHPGKAFIPFYGPMFSPVYGGFIMYKKFWNKHLFWLVLGMFILDMILTASGNPGLVTFAWVFTLAIAVFTLILDIKIAKGFGKSAGFGVGLFFLYPIFLGILAWGSAQYLGDDNDTQNMINDGAF